MAVCRSWLFSVALIYIACYLYYLDFDNLDPRMYMETPQLIKYHGYEGEEYEIESDDGFLTRIHRLLPKSKKKNLPIVLLVPGIHCSSAILLGLGPGHDYAYNISDNNFDLWVTNFRGNKYSRPKPGINFTHEQLSDFSFHEQGVYDVAAAIDFILKYTGQNSLQVNAGSMAANAMYALLATRPEYNSKISKMLILGPTGFFTVLTTWTQSILLTLLQKTAPINDYFATALKYRVEFAHMVCGNRLSPVPCYTLVNNYLGFVSDRDPKMAELAIVHMMTGPFNGVYLHIAQTMFNGAFEMRDRKERNRELYGSDKPPLYNMDNVKVPTKLYYYEDDLFLDEAGVKKMLDFIPNKFDVYLVKKPFGHANFMANTALSPSLITDIIATLKIKLDS